MRALGIRDLFSLNEASLDIWTWRFASERNPHWEWVIVGEYGQVEVSQCTEIVREGHSVGVCMDIKGNWESIKIRTRFKVGTRRRVKFWKDKWCGDSSLIESCPHLTFLKRCLGK